MYTRIVIKLLLVVVLIGSVPTASAKRICDQCKQVITGGRSIEVDGRFFHTEHFNCGYCSKSIGSQKFYEHEGAYYDSDCYAEHIATRCRYCNKPILSNYVKAEGEPYHHDCYLDHVAVRCVFCGIPISDQYYTDPFGNVCCSEHYENAPVCFSCKRFLYGGKDSPHRKYADGRLICGSCLATAVTGLDEAEKILREIKEQLNEAGISISPNVDISLVTLEQLHEVSDEVLPDQLGVAVFEEQRWDNGEVAARDYRIHVLVGLPEYHFRSVIAHELMHVWIFRNGQAETIDPLLSEGSCNYSAYLILLRDKSEVAGLMRERMLADDDSVYGEGFRKVKEYVERVGTNRWLAYLRDNSRPPW